jgi:hypothetical protein
MMLMIIEIMCNGTTSELNIIIMAIPIVKMVSLYRASYYTVSVSVYISIHVKYVLIRYPRSFPALGKM